MSPRLRLEFLKQLGDALDEVFDTLQLSHAPSFLKLYDTGLNGHIANTLSIRGIKYFTDSILTRLMHYLGN